jgi:hypothetical protein
MSIKEPIIQKRAELYDIIRNNPNVERDHGIYLDFKIYDNLLTKLEHCVINYIAKTLQETYKNDQFVIDKHFLLNYEKKILSLPNRTPNGAFHPKKENITEYNKLQKNIVNTLKELGILKHCLAVQPCTVRIMCGKNTELDHTRPLATTKLHSDSWASHIGDAILGVPLLGDPATTLEFYEPQNVTDDFFSPLLNYDEGLKKFKDKKFLGYARMGYISIFDHACLHRTSLKNGNIRVSFDFGIIMNNKNSLYYESHKRKKVNLEDYRYEYFDTEMYSRLGDDLFVSVEETLEQAKHQYSQANSDNYQRAPIKIVEKI